MVTRAPDALNASSRVPGTFLRLFRTLPVGLTVVTLVIVGPWEVSFLSRDLGSNLGGDYVFFRGIAERWLESGTLYLPHQLAGPYHVQLQVDNLYPPHALFLFLPFTVLPALLWWVVPLGITGYVIARLRPARWSWPILALLVIWPKTLVGLLWGNTDMWVMAAIAAGVRWGWPATLVTIKPVFAPFALVGIRERSFWLAGVALAAIGLLMLPLWQDYIAAIRNTWLPVEYSLRSLPAMLIPTVAWLARRRENEESVGDEGLGVATVGQARMTDAAGSTQDAGDRP